MRRRIKAVIFLLGAAVTLFAINSFYIANHNPMLSEDTKSIDTTKVSAEKLFEKNWQVIKNEYYDSSFNHQHWSKWKNRYQGKIKNEDDAKVAIDTMIASLDDPYSRYITNDEFAEQNVSITSKISGIGVNITNHAGKIRIMNVIEETPAQFDFLRSKQKINKKIIRKEIIIKTVKSTNDKNIGYIQITSFISNSTPHEFLEALENTQKSKGLIVDLRGNTGGLLTNAIFIANLFIQKGRLVSIVGRNGYKYDIMAQDVNVDISKPVIILVNGASASASEILSGAMKDYHKAKILGTQTYGKGMVQKIIPMPDETGLNLTIAKYLTPKGTDINKKGIRPDVEVKFTKKDIQNKKDVQLEKAKQIMQRIIAKNDR